jgi:mitochondrial fission protein ELM1
LSESIKTCWIITEGQAGTENQCLGLAEALGVQPVVKRIKLKSPWRQLSPWLCFGHEHALAAGSDPIDAPYPDLLIASGRKSIGIALHIKKQSGGKTFLVQVQDPRISPKHFDLVIVPQHDPTRGDNVLVTTGSLHRVTPEKIAAEKSKFASTLSALPAPRVAVLIGGSSKSHQMTAAATQKLTDQLLALKASLMITASRRTGAENINTLKSILCRHSGESRNPETPAFAGVTNSSVYFWDGEGENPYFALLGFADYIIVTEDSVSMTSEALSTGKPVYTAALEGGAKRLDAFHRLLREQGYTRPFTGELEMWSYSPLQDTMKAAHEIRRRMKIKG